jgi:hypothetical protein
VAIQHWFGDVPLFPHGYCDFGEGVLTVEIVRIDPREDVAITFFYSFIDGVRLTQIMLTDPVGQPFFIFFDYIKRFISGTTIDD